MNNSTLFGGALFAAGLAAAVTQPAAADFAFSFTETAVGAYAIGGQPSYDLFSGAETWSVLAEEPGAIGMSMGTAESVTMSAESDGGAASYASIVVSFFTVTEDVVGSLTWDFSGGFGTFVIDNLTDNVNLVFANDGPATTFVIFEAGKDYVLGGFAFSDLEDDGRVFAELTISDVPAPAAALPLIAAGGLCVTRRRRRE